ncbi:MAG: Gfo/Idh/MocA family oxidoreductase [Chloroflexi bacterium]|nr:Gfo/Idh/MocA family oxidoreductase [Chloroflexota bacterium]
MPEQLRFAQIGIAHTHANNALTPESRAVMQRLNVAMAGIYEPDPDMLRARRDRAEYRDMRWYDSYDEILKDPTIAAVYIQSWPWECLYWARKALEAGKHIHLDKPPGLSAPMLRSLYDIAASKGLHIQMGYMWRFNAGFEFILKSVREGLIGRVTFARFRAGSVPEYWHRNSVHQFPGGIMQEESSHLFDQVVALFGRPDRVTAVNRSDARGFQGMPPGIDNSVVVLEFEAQGAMAVIEATALETSPGPHRHAEIHGLDGSIIMMPIEPPKVELCLREPRAGYKEGWQNIPVEDRARYFHDVEEFIQVIRGERQPRFGPDHDLTVQETIVRAAS